ncbi:MAG: double-strand break repair helicase AddA [Ponticaulis sp.]|nr:double-strand break repair helicase AddA [Ponticaulis sp.]|tara:strand:- start:40853 stop:44350 length:3498 start_codon:yes stop_codon:yes gene_type:complete
MTPYDRVSAAQRQAAEPDASIWVSANAGSGKTKVLIDRVARLLLTGVPPDSILCITYTKAAASEMQQRLFKRLGSWSVLEDEKLLAELNELQGKKLGLGDSQLADARALFAKALETPGGLRIETLHAFAGRVLRRFPLEAGVPPGFQELDEVDSAELWHSASRAVFDQLVETEDGKRLFSDLMREVGGLRYDGAISLVQGNATKLRTFLAAHPTPDARFDALSAALNAPHKPRVAILDELIGSGLPRDRIGRTISLLEGGSAKTDIALASTLRDVLEAATPEIALNLYRSVFLKKDGELRAKGSYTKAFVGTPVDDLFAIPGGTETTRFLAGLDALNAAALRDRTLTLLEMAAPLLDAHAKEKRIRAGLDFDDLILETRSLLTRAGLAEWVLYKLDGGLSHVLLDEAQDTSPDQWQIVNALVAEFFTGTGTAEFIRTLFVVGDEKQSIYSFQGADTARFQAERQHFASRQSFEGPEIHLPDVQMSFRSTPQVLGFVDAVFNGPASQGGAPFSHEVPAQADLIEHFAFRDQHTGQVEIWPLEEPDAKPNGVPWHAPMDMERQKSAPRLLANQLADWIADRLAPNAPGVFEEGRDAPARPAQPGDILILVRSRKALFHAIIQALKAKGLPVAGADRLNILDTLAVQDLLNLIRFAALPENDLVTAEILKGPFIGLTEKDENRLFTLAHDRGRESLWSRMQASDDPRLTPAIQFLKEVLSRRYLPAFEFLSWVLNTRHVAFGETGWQLINARFGSPAKDPVEALISIAASLEDVDGANLQAFLLAVEEQAGEIKREASGPANEIRVMTVHGSKGLEAPIVILPDTTGVGQNRLSGQLQFDESALPVWLGDKTLDCEASLAIRQVEEAKARAESHRLLYVALTRAKDQLVICGAWHGRSKTGYAENSWYDLCRQTAELWQGGDQLTTPEGHWQIGSLPAPEIPVIRPAASRQHAILPDWINRTISGESIEPRLSAPSQLLPGDTPVLPPFGKDQVRRFQRGRLIHALLEILPDVPLADRQARAERYLAQCLDPEEAQIADDILTTAFSVLEDPELAHVFGPGGRAEAPIVGSGPNLPQGVTINGRIDRMRVTDTHVWVIDYKTDRPPPKTPDQVAQPYLAQMGSYYDVLSVTYPNKIVKCALLWTDGPHFMVLDESVMLAALKKAQAEN